MKKIFAVFTVILLLVVCQMSSPSISSAAEPEFTFTYADYASPGYDQLNYIRHYIDRIGEETKGRVEIKLYPAQQLVKALQQYEAVMKGTIDMTSVTPVYFAGKIPMLLLTSESSYWRSADNIVIVSRVAETIEKILARDGIKFMGWSTEISPVCLVGPKVFKELDDFKGMKIRAPGKASKLINLWGGTGVAIPASETYMAMQRKVVDGAFTGIGTALGSRLWEVTDCITFLPPGGTPQMACMNMEKWKSLPDDIKKSFEKVNREMVPWAHNHAKNYVSGTEETLKKKFKKWHVRTDEEHEAFAKYSRGYIVGPVLKKFGEPAQKFWDKILAVAKECEDARKQGKTPRFFED